MAGGLDSNKLQSQRLAGYLEYTKQLEAVFPVWRLGPGSALRQASLLACGLLYPVCHTLTLYLPECRWYC